MNINDVRNATPEELAALQKQAYRNIATFVAVKIGVAVAVHYGVQALVKKYAK